jgi:hypothetical protein
MRHLAAVLVAGTVALTACDKGPTEPTSDLQPQSQAAAAATQVNISGSGKAEMWTPPFAPIDNVDTHATFTCPEGERAFIRVTVEQRHPDGSESIGQTGKDEFCRAGPNTVTITVAGVWDVARAHATWQLFTLSVTDVDEKDILINAR